jgi:NADH-quinone oxidoreductase subunit M
MCMPLDKVLTITVLLPLGIGCILFLHRFLPSAVSKLLAFVGFVAPLGLSSYLAYCYTLQAGQEAYAFYSSYPIGLKCLGIQLCFGLNPIALPLFVLTALVGCAGGCYTLFSRPKEGRLYEALLLLVFGGLLGAFASVDLFFMYFFHEIALIPTFIMMGLWGFVGRRSAAIELAVYLSLGALIALAGFIALYVFSNCPSFNLIHLSLYLQALPLDTSLQASIAGLLLLGLGILVSLFPFYSWAPRAYATAPTALAMLHAGVLKKFGLYALIQVGIRLVPLGFAAYTPYVIALGLANILLIGFVTLAQRDLKLMASYSSIMHMGYCFLGLACFALPGLQELALGGTLFLMVGHGLSIALVFLLSNSICQRTRTQDMPSMGGLCQRAPVLSAFFIAATFASIGLPGFLNFWGELSIFMVLWAYNPYICALAALGIIISAIYGLRSIAYIFFGKPQPPLMAHFKTIEDIRWFERMPAILLLAALLLLGCFPKMLFHLKETLKPVASILP